MVSPSEAPTEKPDDIPNKGERVQWLWSTDQGDRWYGGKVVKINEMDVIVLYDDGSKVPHSRASCRHRRTWYYDEVTPSSKSKKRRKLYRGSGLKGERNGVHFDQYERNEQDGTCYGEAQRRADRADEALYAKRRRREKQRSTVDPKRQGYEDDGFVVPDEY